MKNGTLKQIGEWASQGRQNVECGRNTGKLSDNVTEERLLRARIWDLSKERYKFLSQSDYEKRIFLDRQLRKKKLYEEIMKTVDMKKTDQKSKEMRRAIERRESVKSFSKDVTSKNDGANSERNSKLRETRSALKERTSGWTPPIRNSSSAIGVPISDQTSEYTSSSTSKMRSGLFQTEPAYPIRPRGQALSALPVVNDVPGPKFFTKANTFGRIASTPSMTRKISFADDGNRRTIKSSKSWHGPGDNRAMESSPTQDHRYQSLARCLSDTWRCDTTLPLPEVKDVISNNSSLYERAKNGRDRKTNGALKFQRHLSEQGIMF